MLVAEWAVRIARENSRIRLAEYADGALCVLFDGRRLSVNIPPFSRCLQPGIFAVKNWDDPAFVQVAMDSGLFEDTGHTIPSGFVEAPVWKIKGHTPEIESK